MTQPVDLRDYIRILRKRWRIVTAAALLMLALASVLTLTATPIYQAEAQLFVSTSGKDDASSLLQGSSFTQQRVKSYAELVTSPPVLTPVIDRLHLNTTPQVLATSITADAPLDTVLINVTVRDSSPEQAAAIAAEVAKTFSATVAELEKPTDSNAAAPVKVSVVREPSVPTSPVSPKPVRNLALGLLLGLAAGVGLALLRELLDTSIRTEADVLALTDAPLIGGINFDSRAVRRPLIVHDSPHSPRAESFRQLRTNLQFVDVANHPRSIVFTSALPNEGKSTTTANLAITLAAAGSRTALIEADLRRPRVAEYLGLEGAVGLTNVLIGQAKLEDVMQPWGTGLIDVLACGPIPPNPSELLGSQVMNDMLRDLENRYDYVIIDAPPLLPVTDAAVLSRLAGGAVVVVGASRVNRDQLSRAFDILDTVGAQVLGVVLNLVPAKGPDAQSYYSDGYAPVMPESRPQPTRNGRAKRKSQIRAERLTGSRAR
ncbi:polysaccharide biosynthesis tyrosine autokinase [Angustibacter sp. McL0619]|uniref:polysaccharide biosynthesis tyrosine autokinase n=1 Tax=Angustibacter sp. McL0619 TaxID=3415676 RepID=UPI003CEDD1DC